MYFSVHMVRILWPGLDVREHLMTFDIDGLKLLVFGGAGDAG